jgi:hypothetical protein
VSDFRGCEDEGRARDSEEEVAREKITTPVGQYNSDYRDGMGYSEIELEIAWVIVRLS